MRAALATLSLSACLAPALSAAEREDPVTPAAVLAEAIRTALPRQVERSDDWGRTKRVTTGVRVSGKFYWPQFRRREKQLRHGVWKRYRVRFVEPDERLSVKVENLRALDENTYACTLIVDGALEGWAQTRVFNRGVHVVTLTAEGESRVRLAIECETTLKLSLSSGTLTAAPRVTSSKLDLEDFRLKRLGELHGDPASELGKGLRKLAEEWLDGPRLTAKLNRAIEKKRDRLQAPLTPSFLADALGDE